MVAKLAMLVLVMALTSASLLVVRQQRLQAVREMADAAERAAEFDRTLWRMRVEIAGRVTPSRIGDMSAAMGPMLPIPVTWGDASLASDASPRVPSRDPRLVAAEEVDEPTAPERRR